MEDAQKPDEESTNANVVVAPTADPVGAPEDIGTANTGGTGFSPVAPICPAQKKRRSDVLPQIEFSRLEEYRRLLMPLSKDQMLDLLARASCTHDDVFTTAKTIVDESPAARRLMVRNISFATENSSLYTVFGQFGQIEDFTIVREKDGKSKGFGFVTFKSVEAVKLALSCPITLDARSLIVKLASDAQSDTVSEKGSTGSSTFPSPGVSGTFTDPKAKRKLFIRNLSDYTTTERLKQAFSSFGGMEDCIVVHDPGTGKSKGYGFVTFLKQEDALRAVQQPQRIIDSQMCFVAFASAGNGAKTGDRMNPNLAQLGVPRGGYGGMVQTQPGIPQALDPASYAHLYNAQQMQQQIQHPQLYQAQAAAAQVAAYQPRL